MGQVKCIACFKIHVVSRDLRKFVMQIVYFPARFLVIEVQPDDILAVRIRASNLVDIAIIYGN